jgi:hypothetical protein
MLGRLRMSIDDCIEAYLSLSDEVFQKKAHRVKLSGKLQGRFDSAALERAVKRILVTTGHDENVLLKVTPGKCRVYYRSLLPPKSLLTEPLQIRLRDEQTNRRHRLPHQLPHPPVHRPARHRQDLAGLPRHLSCNNIFRPHCHWHARRGGVCRRRQEQPRLRPLESGLGRMGRSAAGQPAVPGVDRHRRAGAERGWR